MRLPILPISLAVGVLAGYCGAGGSSIADELSLVRQDRQDG